MPRKKIPAAATLSETIDDADNHDAPAAVSVPTSTSATEPAAANTPDAPHMIRRRNRLVQEFDDFVPLASSVADVRADADDDDDSPDDDATSNYVDEPTTLDMLLADLHDNNDAAIYVIRKPDSPSSQVKFRVACNQQMSVGELPIEDDFRDRYSVEAAVQAAFGGGRYQLQVRVRGTVQKSWTTTIADPVVRDEPRAATTTASPVPTSAVNSSGDVLADIIARERQIDELVSIRLRRQGIDPRRRDATEQQTRKSTRDELLEAKELYELISPPGEASAPPIASSESTGIVGQIASLVDALGRHAPKLAPVVANLVAQSGAAAQSPAEAGDDRRARQSSPPQRNPAAAMLPPALRSVLNLIVQDATADAPVDRVHDAIRGVVEAQPEMREQLAALLKQPSISILETVAQLTGAHYITRIKYTVAWTDALKAELEGEGTDEENDDEDDAETVAGGVN